MPCLQALRKYDHSEMNRNVNILSGHIQGVSYRKRIGVNGNVVYEVPSDFQFELVLGSGTVFGNGWLRVLNFVPSQNKISVETLSVEAGNSSIFPSGTPQTAIL